MPGLLKSLQIQALHPLRAEYEFVNVKEAQELIQRHRSTSLFILADSIPWNRFLGSLNVYTPGLWKAGSEENRLLRERGSMRSVSSSNFQNLEVKLKQERTLACIVLRVLI